MPIDWKKELDSRIANKKSSTDWGEELDRRTPQPQPQPQPSSSPTAQQTGGSALKQFLSGLIDPIKLFQTPIDLASRAAGIPTEGEITGLNKLLEAPEPKTFSEILARNAGSAVSFLATLAVAAPGSAIVKAFTSNPIKTFSSLLGDLLVGSYGEEKAIQLLESNKKSKEEHPLYHTFVRAAAGVAGGMVGGAIPGAAMWVGRKLVGGPTNLAAQGAQLSDLGLAEERVEKLADQASEITERAKGIFGVPVPQPTTTQLGNIADSTLEKAQFALTQGKIVEKDIPKYNKAVASLTKSQQEALERIRATFGNEMADSIAKLKDATRGNSVQDVQEYVARLQDSARQILGLQDYKNMDDYGRRISEAVKLGLEAAEETEAKLWSRLDDIKTPVQLSREASEVMGKEAARIKEIREVISHKKRLNRRIFSPTESEKIKILEEELLSLEGIGPDYEEARAFSRFLNDNLYNNEALLKIAAYYDDRITKLPIRPEEAGRLVARQAIAGKGEEKAIEGLINAVRETATKNLSGFENLVGKIENILPALEDPSGKAAVGEAVKFHFLERFSNHVGDYAFKSPGKISQVQSEIEKVYSAFLSKNSPVLRRLDIYDELKDSVRAISKLAVNGFPVTPNLAQGEALLDNVVSAAKSPDLLDALKNGMKSLSQEQRQAISKIALGDLAQRDTKEISKILDDKDAVNALSILVGEEGVEKLKALRDITELYRLGQARVVDIDNIGDVATKMVGDTLSAAFSYHHAGGILRKLASKLALAPRPQVTADLLLSPKTAIDALREYTVTKNTRAAKRFANIWMASSRTARTLMEGTKKEDKEKVSSAPVTVIEAISRQVW